MVIKLNGADFSADNIGKIILPRELNPFTLSAIELSGNSSMTNEQKKALDIFFEDIGAFGTKSNIWSKLDKVYLPMICSVLAKSCINYVSGNTDAVPDSSWIQMRSHGICSIPDVTKGDNLILDSNYQWNWGNKSAFVFNTEKLENNNVALSGIFNYKGGVTPFESLLIYGQDTANPDNAWIRAYTANSVYLTVDNPVAQYKTTPSLKGLSSNGETVVSVFGDVTKLESINSSAVQNFNSTAKNLIVASNAFGNIVTEAKPLGAMVLGSYLTQEECNTLSAAFSDLWAAFNV